MADAWSHENGIPGCSVVATPRWERDHAARLNSEQKGIFRAEAEGKGIALEIQDVLSERWPKIQLGEMPGKIRELLAEKNDSVMPAKGVMR